MRAIAVALRRLEGHAWLARVGIDAEHQELDRNGAEVDPAVDQRLRRILVGLAPRVRPRGPGQEQEVDNLVDRTLYRIERHDTGLVDLPVHTAGDPQASAATRHIEAGLELRQGRQSGEIGDTGADMIRLFKFYMKSGLRYFGELDRHAPCRSILVVSHLWSVLCSTHQSPDQGDSAIPRQSRQLSAGRVRP